MIDTKTRTTTRPLSSSRMLYSPSETLTIFVRTPVGIENVIFNESKVALISMSTVLCAAGADYGPAASSSQGPFFGGEQASMAAAIEG